MFLFFKIGGFKLKFYPDFPLPHYNALPIRVYLTGPQFAGFLDMKPAPAKPT